ncbi:hypothetical protein GIB67_010475 [Kingdonia uniflora]|uniref:dolichol kinase n=1 Tax=Kingdonia uniflora TaxID=39325 RepID=A0A7J7MAI3_9MAGN|nr:hypothetical protein GIB67_010475 [Kingdonia uniflora]
MELLLSLINGERAVVFLFIFRLIFSVPLSLFYQGFAICLLAFAALFVEISAQRSSNALIAKFKTRPGASSGILLGALTLPTVMLSRLIQLSRLLLSHHVQPQDITSLTVQYWAVSASCFSVLVFLLFILRDSDNKNKVFNVKTARDSGFILLYTLLYATVCSLSLATKLHSVLHAATMLLWVFCHGFAAVKLIQHVHRTFPLCSSMGEALLVTAGITLYFGDMLGYTLVKLETYLTPSSLASASYEMKRSEISTIIQGVLAGLLLFPFLYKFILLVCSHCIFWVSSEASATKKKMSNGIAKSLVFYISLAVTLLVIVPAWMQFVQDFHMHPVSWVLNFVFTEPFKIIPLCIYWIGVICASVLRFYSISKSSKIERILLRKYYHLMAVLMFLPALIFQPSFLDLAFGAALAVFLLLEIIRVWKIWPLGELVHQFMNAFTDHRDSDLLIVSHFSLLLGCALPKWMSSGFNDRPLAPFAGILSLGIGDTMASIIGYKYGVLRWSKTGKKTIEGTAAGITSVLAACSVLLPLLASTGFILSQHWLSLLLAVIVSGLLEAYTAQLDNAFIPLVFYSLLCL